jgi:EpsI family protein
MTTKRLLVLLAVVAIGMGSVFVLPKQLGYQPVGAELSLPEFLGEWWGKEGDVLEKERDVLGHDTDFARKIYSSGADDNILASVVLAGQDMMTSIHRPERCLTAQGWQVGHQSKRVIDVPGLGGLEATRLQNLKYIRGPNGEAIPVNNLCYYWFIGHSARAATHEERVWRDMLDRIAKGYNQRWAMVMISAEITKDLRKFGRDERQTDVMLQDFIKLIAPKLQKPSVQSGS